VASVPPAAVRAPAVEQVPAAEQVWEVAPGVGLVAAEEQIRSAAAM